MSDTKEPSRLKRVKRDEVRRRLLSAGFTVFAQRGYEGASLERVAEAAGFSKGAVYSNFANKDELFFEMVAVRIDERIEAVRSATEIELNIDGQPRAVAMGKLIGKKLADLGSADPEWQMLFVEFWLRCARNENLRQRLAEKRLLMRSKLAGFIITQARAFDIDLAPNSAMELASTVLALSNGLGIEGLIEPLRPELFGEILAKIVAGTTFKPS